MTIHTTTKDAVHIRIGATDDAMLAAIRAAHAGGLPLRVSIDSALSVVDLRYIGALAAGLYPECRWLWSLTHWSSLQADLLHQRGER